MPFFALTQGGLTNKDVQWVFTNSAVDAANTFKAGHVDACVSWSPDVYIAADERDGLRRSSLPVRQENHDGLPGEIHRIAGDRLGRSPRHVHTGIPGGQTQERLQSRKAFLTKRSSSE